MSRKMFFSTFTKSSVLGETSRVGWSVLRQCTPEELAAYLLFGPKMYPVRMIGKIFDSPELGKGAGEYIEYPIKNE